MTIQSLQDILPLVERPSRYLGTEINSFHKDHRTVKLRVALAFPDLYEIGTSHFGIQILYSMLNQQNDVLAERVYAPAPDMEARLRSAGLALASLESRTPIRRFDIVGFSLLYELNFTNMLTILDLAGIPFYSARRDDSHPILIAGGPCMCNPEPVADFFDAIVVGDGEAVILEMVTAWLTWKEGGGGTRKDLLKEWSKLKGVYVPAFFHPEYTPAGLQILTAQDAAYQRVSRAAVDDLDAAFFPAMPVVPYGKPIHDRLRLEVARGCTRGCRFCQAGMIYRPVRERSPHTLLSQATEAFGSTGYENLSLLSLSTGDYSNIIPLMEQLTSCFQKEKVAVSLPSMRAETLTPNLMNLIRRIRKTGFTIAPEAGSQRLRNVINKNISDADIYQTVDDAFRLGWRVIKLYFMIGLPTETEDDLHEIVHLVKNLRKQHRRKGQLNVSVAAFIPKPHTPFQWAAQTSVEAARDKIEWLKSQLRFSGVHLKWQNPEMSILEGLWARGDRRLASLLSAAYQKGCRLDGWSDRFRYSLWKAALSETGIEADFYTTRRRDFEEPLPWDHIDIGPNKRFLAKEWIKALDEQNTSDCRTGSCADCGACDFVRLKPRTYETVEHVERPVLNGEENRKESGATLKLTYAKKDQSKHFGHLELKNIFFRAIRRAGISVKYSEGFHPQPKVSFDDPLPVGMESEGEGMYMTLEETMPPEAVLARLNRELPEGLVVNDCRCVEKKDPGTKPPRATYQVILKTEAFDPASITAFQQSTQWPITRKTRNGKEKLLDLHDFVVAVQIKSSKHIEITIQSDKTLTLRPSEVITHLFRFPETVLRQARIVKSNS